MEERNLLFTFALGQDTEGNQPRSQSISVRATTDLGAFPESSPRDRIAGKLLDVSKEQLLKISCGNDTRVMINEGDAGYRFIKLGDDGSFELIRMKR